MTFQNRNRTIRVVLFLALSSLSMAAIAQVQKDSNDFYGKVALQEMEKSISGRLMDTIYPIQLPSDRILSWSHHKKYTFAPYHQIADKKEMNDSLSAYMSHYKPFMADYAPKMQEVRMRVRFDKMSFRYETKEDQSDFLRLLRGEGDWKEVNMPYFHGPQGLSTAWYRKEINISQEQYNQPSLWLQFNAVDYYADAFVNGQHVGSHEGMLDEFSFDIKKYAHIGKNIILVKVGNDYSMLGGEGTPRRWGNKLSASNSAGWDEPQMGWPCAPAGFGIYQEMYLETRSTPYIADIFCRPLLDSCAVELWVEIDLTNGDLADTFTLKYALFGQNFQEETAFWKQDSIKVVGGRILKKYIISLNKEKMRIWSPDTPWLYQMQVALYDKGGKVLLDTQKRQFGMRKFVLDSQSVPKGRMYLNNEEIRLRGTNTMGFLQKDVITHDWEQLVKDLLLVKLTHINFIRTTQRILPREVYDYADKVGMMMQSDLPLFGYINQKQYTEVLKQADGIERVLRNHPSVILLSYLNESMAGKQPHAVSRYAYERLFDALDIVVHNQNPDQAVKYVDGDYQAPNKGYPDTHCYNIWYDKHALPLEQLCRGAWVPISKGWMYGCGEFGAEGLDFPDLMRRRYPQEWLNNQPDGTWNPSYIHGKWQGEQTWDKHWKWFETQYTMEDWVRESQNHQAWGVSKVSRAFRRMARMNSFAVHLFIDAWPNGWMKAIMDCERTPKPAWFVYRDALTPLSVQVETERTAFYSNEKYPFQVWICNDTQHTPSAYLQYTMEVNGKITDSGKAAAEVPDISKAVSFQGFLPVTMPEVKIKTDVKIHVGLFDQKTNRILHEETANVWVYPKVQATLTKNIIYCGKGDEMNSIRKMLDSQGKSLSNELYGTGDIFITDGILSSAQQEIIEKGVKNGAKALVLRDSISSFKFSFPVNFGKPNDCWIVFRNTSHPWIKGTTSTDLKYNYSSILQKPERHFYQTFNGKDITPILTQKEGLVMGEKNDGKGKWIICTLKLAGKVETTPALMQVIQHIFQ